MCARQAAENDAPKHVDDPLALDGRRRWMWPVRHHAVICRAFWLRLVARHAGVLPRAAAGRGRSGSADEPGIARTWDTDRLANVELHRANDAASAFRRARGSGPAKCEDAHAKGEGAPHALVPRATHTLSLPANDGHQSDIRQIPAVSRPGSRR